MYGYERFRSQAQFSGAILDLSSLSISTNRSRIMQVRLLTGRDDIEDFGIRSGRLFKCNRVPLNEKGSMIVSSIGKRFLFILENRILWLLCID